MTSHQSSSGNWRELIGRPPSSRHVTHVNTSIICLCVIMRCRVIRHNQIKIACVDGPMILKTVSTRLNTLLIARVHCTLFSIFLKLILCHHGAILPASYITSVIVCFIYFHLGRLFFSIKSNIIVVHIPINYT